MPRAFITRVIIPLLGVANSSGVFISTIDNDDDPFADMLLRPQQDGTFIMNVLNYNLQVCQLCMKHGLTECEHALSQMPRWLDTSKSRKLLKLFPEAEYEFQGVADAGDTTQAFRPVDIKEFFEGKKHENNIEPPLYIIGIDPSSGGQSSNWAIVTLYQDPRSDMLVVKGFENESIPANEPERYRSLIRNHILRLRAEHGGANVKIMIGMESNLGYLTAEVKHYLKACPDVCSNLHFIHESPSRNKKKLNVGIWTTNYTKNAMYNIAERYLDQQAIRLDARILEPRRELKENELTHLQEFRRQMTQYEIREVVDRRGNTTTFLHGKRDGRKDDLISALGMGLLTVHLVYESKQLKYLNIVRGR